MKKVLFLINASSGLYDFRNELVEELLKKYEVVASVPDDRKKRELEEEGVKVIHTPINRRGVNPKEDLKLYRAYKKLMQEEKPDLVLTYTIKPTIYGGYAASKCGVPYISTITGLGSAFERTGLFKRMIVAMYTMAFRKVSCVFFQNETNKKIFEECGIIKNHKTKMVSGSGVNLKAHPFTEYPAETDGTLFLYMGRNMKEKGTDELLQAAYHFKDRQDVRFLLLGYSEEDYKDVLTDYESKGILSTHDFVPDVNEYVARASAVVLPSYHEGMSNVLQEASAMGRPVIASNIPGCREIFEEGVTGFGCEPGSAESLIAAMERFLALPREERAIMGQRAHDKVEREFNRENVVQAYVEEIQQTVL